MTESEKSKLSNRKAHEIYLSITDKLDEMQALFDTRFELSHFEYCLATRVDLHLLMAFRNKQYTINKNEEESAETMS